MGRCNPTASDSRPHSAATTRVRMPVHDELVYDLEPGKTGIAELLDLQSIPLSVPLLWDTKFGKNWMEANDA